MKMRGSRSKLMPAFSALCLIVLGVLEIVRATSVPQSSTQPPSFTTAAAAVPQNSTQPPSFTTETVPQTSTQPPSFTAAAGDTPHVFALDLATGSAANAQLKPFGTLSVTGTVGSPSSHLLTLFGSVFARDLSGNVTAAHIHGPATATGVAPVVATICGPPSATACNGVTALPATSLFEWTQPLPSSGVVLNSTLFMNGLLYLNIHTTLNGNGELRGQLAAKPPHPSSPYSNFTTNATDWAPISPFSPPIVTQIFFFSDALCSKLSNASVVSSNPAFASSNSCLQMSIGGDITYVKAVACGANAAVALYSDSSCQIQVEAFSQINGSCDSSHPPDGTAAVKFVCTSTPMNGTYTVVPQNSTLPPFLTSSAAAVPQNSTFQTPDTSSSFGNRRLLTFSSKFYSSSAIYISSTSVKCFVPAATSVGRY